MTRALSWLAYRLADFLEFRLGCPTFASWVDWLFELQLIELFRAILYWIVCLLAALAIGLGLAGCVTFDADPYWKRVADPMPVKRVEYADKVICRGVEVWGCADYEMQVIRISRKAPFSLWACIEEHERTHFQGYTHPVHHNSLGGVWCNLTTFKGY